MAISNQNDGEETTFEEWTSIKKATSHDQWLVAQSKLKLAVGLLPYQLLSEAEAS